MTFSHHLFFVVILCVVIYVLYCRFVRSHASDAVVIINLCICDRNCHKCYLALLVSTV